MNDVRNLIQELIKSQQAWQKNVVISMFNEIERLRKLLGNGKT